VGSEVKSLRDGNANIGDAYVVHTRSGELILYNSTSRLMRRPTG
jgi:tmRNA-binding protein